MSLIVQMDRAPYNAVFTVDNVEQARDLIKAACDKFVISHLPTVRDNHYMAPEASVAFPVPFWMSKQTVAVEYKIVRINYHTDYLEDEENGECNILKKLLQFENDMNDCFEKVDGLVADAIENAAEVTEDFSIMSNDLLLKDAYMAVSNVVRKEAELDWMSKRATSEVLESCDQESLMTESCAAVLDLIAKDKPNV